MSEAVCYHESKSRQVIAAQADNVRLYGAAFDRAASQGREAVRTAMFARLLAGAALVAIKNQCGHGEFEEVCLREFPTTPLSTRQNWKARADQDLRHKELREATEAVLLNGEDDGVRKAFEDVADKYFVAKPTLLLHAAQEMHLLGHRAERKPAARKPAPRLTPEQQLAKRREMAVLSFAECETQLAGCSTSFTVLEDFAVSAQIAALERHVAARRRWLATPAKSRDARAVDAVHAVLNPPKK